MKAEASGTVRVRVYPVLARAVEEGTAIGWARAHQYVDSPSPESIRDAVAQAILSELCDVLMFDEDT